MNSKLAFAVALSSSILAGKAHAQSAAPQLYVQQNLAHVSVQAAPATELEIVPAGAPMGSPAIARCTEYCDFWALPGKYTLYARGDGDEPKRLSLRIKHSSRYIFDPGDEEAASGGLVLGIVGSAAVMTGMVLLLVAASECWDPNCHSDSTAIVGLGALLGGAIATPIGWAMFASNRAHLKRIDERGYAGSEPLKQVRLGVIGLGRGGFGLGGVATF